MLKKLRGIFTEKISNSAVILISFEVLIVSVFVFIFIYDRDIDLIERLRGWSLLKKKAVHKRYYYNSGGSPFFIEDVRRVNKKYKVVYFGGGPISSVRPGYSMEVVYNLDNAKVMEVYDYNDTVNEPSGYRLTRLILYIPSNKFLIKVNYDEDRNIDGIEYYEKIKESESPPMPSNSY